MKKILNDNMYLFVIIAIALGVWSLVRTYKISPAKKNNKKNEDTTEEKVEDQATE